MNSFISWIGGKKQLKKNIIEQFPQAGSYDRYIEVFGGAGWVLFDKERHAEIEIFNDINGNLINLYRCVKYHPEAMQKELQFSLMSREQFFDQKSQQECRGMTDIQRAERFFLIIKESFGSDRESFGVRSKDMQKMIQYLLEVSQRLNRVVIENVDFERLIKTYDRKSALFYLDPPYFKAEKYYPDRFQPEDHKRLAETLKRIKGRFVLSYNDCIEVRKLYKDCNIIEVDRADSLVIKTQSRRYAEIIVKNY